MLGRVATRVFDWCLRSEGSTRSSALIRIFLVLVLWARWAKELLWFLELEPAYFMLSLSFFASTTLMFLGVFSRLSTLWVGLTTLTMYYYFGSELGRVAWTHHHTYLLAAGALLCALTPCGGSYSVDRLRAVRRAERTGVAPPPERGNLWGLRLIALQLSLIYLFTAYDKTQAAFLSGERMEGYLVQFYVGSDLPRGVWLHVAMVALSWGTLLLEYSLGCGLLFRKTRRWLVVPGLLLHGLFYLTLPVLTYSATMFVLYLAYFDADAVHALIDRLSGAVPSRSARCT